ncbi:MAG: hypothetical protein WBV61_13195 [Rhodanobacteraceae bacterium]
MIEHSVVLGIDDARRRVLVRTPWGCIVAALHSGTIAVGAEIDGARHDLGAQTWRDVAGGNVVEVDVLMPPSEEAVAEKMFIGN